MGAPPQRRERARYGRTLTSGTSIDRRIVGNRGSASPTGSRHCGPLVLDRVVEVFQPTSGLRSTSHQVAWRPGRPAWNARWGPWSGAASTPSQTLFSPPSCRSCSTARSSRTATLLGGETLRLSCPVVSRRGASGINEGSRPEPLGLLSSPLELASSGSSGQFGRVGPAAVLSTLLGISHHGSGLVHPEVGAVAADPPLSEQHRTPVDGGDGTRAAGESVA